MQFVTCTEEAHAEAILAILNEEILSSTALYEYQPRTLDSMADWFATKEANRFPVIGALGEDGRVAWLRELPAPSEIGPPTSTRSSTPSTCTRTTAVTVSAGD